jgi:hypothetical protein
MELKIAAMPVALVPAASSAMGLDFALRLTGILWSGTAMAQILASTSLRLTPATPRIPLTP